jgi:outer membrane protein assembly factor BamB
MTLRRLLLSALFTLACFSAQSICADDWPQWRGPHRDGVWSETGIVERFPDKQLKVDWRAPVGPGYNGPTVAAGRVYVMDRATEPKQVERIHCFDAKTGKPLWDYSYDCNYSKIDYKAGPRAAVTIDSGRAYALGATGRLHCFDAAGGKVLWEKDLFDEYKIKMPIWGITASPIIEGNLVIVEIGGEAACVVAFDRATGEEKWKSLDDRAGYAAPIIIEQAGRRVLICWTGDNIAALNPANGELLWKIPFKPSQMVLNVATPIMHDDRLFVAAFYDGALMAKLDHDKPAAEVLWRRRGPSETNTDAIQPIIATPYFDGDYIYGVDSYGQLRCLDAKNGDRVWEDLTAVPKARWSTIHMVKNGARMFMFNERGELLIARLAPDGFHEISRAQLLEPTTTQLPQRGGVCWSHPAFANKHIYARNDKEIVCANLAADGAGATSSGATGQRSEAGYPLGAASAGRPAVSAVTGSPYPPSPVVRRITWDWSTRRTAAPGSDLWPVTWADDDNLYAAWGDGGGFGGTDQDGRVALGFARIEGPPEHFVGININGGKRSSSSPSARPEHAEGTGEGRAAVSREPVERSNGGESASFPKHGKTGGILAVGRRLYVWLNMQNGKWPDVDEALIWSDDRGATWQTGEWVFAKGQGHLKPSTFLNFGRDHFPLPAAAACYVYFYGQRQGEPNNTYLGRARTANLPDRSTYEYFSGLDRDQPQWSADEHEAQPVFSDTRPNGNLATVVYVPGLKRYLLTSFHKGPGELGIFDAPHPWGPWSTVAYEDHWGDMGNEGEGLTCSFPTKWMSPDGLTLWCTFSAYGPGAKQGIDAHDKFNLVKAKLELRQ